jgi:predicted dehydrogenase
MAAGKQLGIEVKVIAVADVFEDRAKGAQKGLNGAGADIKDDHVFIGLDAYKKLLETDVDIVILATPPGFRPEHFEAAVNAKKHVFMEKPVAVDPVGCRRVMAAGQKAKELGLAVVSGTQRRHSFSYRETIKRIQDGAIGEIVAAYAYWCQGGLWVQERRQNQSDLEWQLRNWLYFTWLSGDHIVEQHVHNIDVINWVMGTHPVSAFGMGGRQVRTAQKYGHIYDHFAVEFEYPNGVRMLSMCRQIDGCDGRVSEFVVGTKGRSNCSGWIRGEKEWRYEGPNPNPYVQEHVHLLESILKGEPINEAQNIAESTMTAIMGRESAYTGRTIRWEEMMKSEMSLMPKELRFDMELPIPPVAMPGRPM